MSRKQNLLLHEDRVRFILAGMAFFSMLSLKTNTVVQYYVRKSKKKPDAPVRYVYTRTGDVMTFIGTIFISKSCKPFYWNSKHSGLAKGNLKVKAFEWIWYKLVRNENYKNVEILHEGRCGRCGRKLTDPVSIETGLGPHCRKLL